MADNRFKLGSLRIRLSFKANKPVMCMRGLEWLATRATGEREVARGGSGGASQGAVIV